MKVWVTPLGKPPKPAKVIAVDEEHLKWMMEDRMNTRCGPSVTGDTDDPTQLLLKQST